MMIFEVGLRGGVSSSLQKSQVNNSHSSIAPTWMPEELLGKYITQSA
jgi:hypothetical protein